MFLLFIGVAVAIGALGDDHRGLRGNANGALKAISYTPALSLYHCR